MGDDGGGWLISPDGVAPSRMVGVPASVISPCTVKVQKKISSGTGSPGWSRKKGRETGVYGRQGLLHKPQHEDLL